MLLAKRVTETNAWQDDGGTDRSAAHWLARRTGTSVGEAQHELATVERLADLPATAEAVRAGRLSHQQARAITTGATADPAAEAELLELAERDSVKALRDAARRAQAVEDDEARQARIHQRTFLSRRAERGAVEHGEVCEIRGVGPVPVSTAKDLLGEAALAVVVKDGVDVRNVTHIKRNTTAHQRTVLEFWGIRCNNVGCDSTNFVDVHHVYEFALHHRTRIDELDVRCRYHHRQEHSGRKTTADQLRRPPPGTAAA